MTLDVKYKDHPRSNISYLIVVLKIWWYVNRCLMFLAINVFFCVTDNWQNNIWHESAYKVEVYTIEFLQEKKKNAPVDIHWHFQVFYGDQTVNMNTSSGVTCFNDVCDKTCSGWPCTIVMPQNIPCCLKCTANDRWL